MEEKRKTLRADCDLAASFSRVHSDHPHLYEVLIDDISEGGARFRSSEFIGLQDKILLKLSLPKRPIIEVMAQPAWSREVSSVSRWDVGLRFLSLGEEDRQTIKNFVSVSLALERLRSLNPSHIFESSEINQ